MTSNDNFPVFDLNEKLFDEIFEQTRPSLDEKELLLTKEETNIFNKYNITAFLLLFALSIHAFFEGIVLGLLDERTEIFYMILAISFHKWVESISIVILNFNHRE
jgi:zinc transporter ZupT